MSHPAWGFLQGWPAMPGRLIQQAGVTPQLGLFLPALQTCLPACRSPYRLLSLGKCVMGQSLQGFPQLMGGGSCNLRPRSDAHLATTSGSAGPNRPSLAREVSDGKQQQFSPVLRHMAGNPLGVFRGVCREGLALGIWL